ncbi:unnamed protein product [Caenorhabditis angaria]|uniref:Uncharacterized protein n=1 Tax=Caenorhabditis angaria TaxID=860376 RepID=A0A9P1N5D2_9PELO|nr:unnamed protein product [Caenorhabditis angaria]
MKEEFKVPDNEEGDFMGPMTNPAASYLDGGNFENIHTKCSVMECSAPIPNDGSESSTAKTLKFSEKACSQIMIPLNGCVSNKGYPMGMLCSVCCDCENSLTREMRKTFGYKIGIDTSLFIL